MNDFENYVYEPIDLWLVIMKSLFSGNRCTATVPPMPDTHHCVQLQTMII